MNYFDLAVAKKLAGGSGGGGGSSDFTTAEMTVHFTFSESSEDVLNAVIFPVIVNNGISYGIDSISIPEGATSKDVPVTVPLYKGKLQTPIYFWALGNKEFDGGGAVSATGNAVIDENYIVTITGNCTITVPVMSWY